MVEIKIGDWVRILPGEWAFNMGLVGFLGKVDSIDHDGDFILVFLKKDVKKIPSKINWAFVFRYEIIYCHGRETEELDRIIKG